MRTNIVAAIIDNDPDSAAELAAMLMGSRLDVAVVGPHGLQTAELIKERRPEVVFVSVESPVIRAEKTLEFVSALLPSTMIVAYAESDDVKLVRRAMQAGAKNFLAAPFTVEEVRQVVRPVIASAARQARHADDLPSGVVMTVVGPKGGIGKTTIATNLAVALHRATSASTLIIDLDTDFGDVAVMLDVELGTGATADSEQQLDREWFDNACTKHISGVHVLPAPAPSESSLASTPEGVERLVAAAARIFDYVILDTPGTFNEVIGASITSSDKVITVTSPELASLKNTGLVLEYLDYSKFPQEDVLVVLNHTTQAAAPAREEITRALGRDISWEVPHDRALRIANQAGRPVVSDAPRSPSAQSLQRFAAVLAGTDAAVARQSAEGLMPTRLHNWRPQMNIPRLLRLLPVTLHLW